MRFDAKNEGTGASNFLKLKSGEKVTGVFAGEVYDFRQHWIKAESKSVPCKGAKNCEICQSGETYTTFRFRLNFITNTQAEGVVSKIFEQGWDVYLDLKAIHEEYGLNEHYVTIERKGTGTDTTYRVMPVAKGALTDNQKKFIGQVKLQNLSHEQPEPSQELPPVSAYANEFPF